MKFIVAVSFILFSIPCAAQQTYTAAKIVFNHPGPYSQAQLEAAVAMHPGMSFSAGELGAAAQRLIDSGYFENAGATLEGQATRATVLFDIQPIPHARMLRVGFENFVWLSHEEIEDALRAQSPLFLDYLPENSPLADVFNGAITNALATKGVPARVTHDSVEPTMLQPDRALEFRIASPTLRVAHVKLAGVVQSLVPLIQISVNAAAKAPYNEGLAGETTANRILSPLLDAGYAQASLSGIMLAPTQSGDTASIVFSATLDPGSIYHVSGISFDGAPLLSAAEFATTEKLHPGDVASRSLLLETLAPLDAAYRRQGYMDVVVKAAPDADPATHQVAYAISVVPGEQYRVHEVTTNNLDAEAKAEFDRDFRMKAGELYNPDYLRSFLKNNTSLQALARYSGSYKAYADPNSHTVDLVLTFMRRMTT